MNGMNNEPKDIDPVLLFATFLRFDAKLITWFVRLWIKSRDVETYKVGREIIKFLTK